MCIRDRCKRRSGSPSSRLPWHAKPPKPERSFPSKSRIWTCRRRSTWPETPTGRRPGLRRPTGSLRSLRKTSTFVDSQASRRTPSADWILMSRLRVAAPVAMAMLAATWGTIPLIVRTVSLPAEQLAALRLWLGAITVLIVLGIRGELRLRRTEPLGRIIVIGVILAIHWAAFFWSLKTTTVAVALVLVYLGPVAMATMARLVL